MSRRRYNTPCLEVSKQLSYTILFYSTGCDFASIVTNIFDNNKSMLKDFNTFAASN